MKRLAYRFYLASDDTEPIWNHSRSLPRIEAVLSAGHTKEQNAILRIQAAS